MPRSDSPAQIAAAIDGYRPTSLTEVQSDLYLATIKDLVRASAPHSILVATQRLTAACVFVGATAHLGEDFDVAFTEARAQGWVNGEVSAGRRSARTVSNEMGRLRVLFRVRDGLPARIKAPNVPLAVVAPLSASIVARLESAVSAADVSARRGYLAAFGSGMWGPHIAGGVIERTTDDRWVATSPDGVRRYLPKRFYSLCRCLDSRVLSEADTDAFKRVASAEGIALTPVLALQTWRAAVIAVEMPMVRLIRDFGLSTDSMSKLLPHLAAEMTDEDLVAVFRDGGRAVPGGAVTVAVISPSSEDSPGAMVTKISKADARRRAKAYRDFLDSPEPLAPELQSQLDDYVPATIDPETWVAIAEVFRWVMERSRLTSIANFDKHRGVLARYLAWRSERAMSIAVTDAMTLIEIDRYVADGMGEFDQKTRNDYRTRLRNLAVTVNAGPDAAPRIVTGTAVRVRPPYTDAEIAKMCRVARNYGKNAEVRRQMCAVIGLAAGAGLDSVDLRLLRRSDIDDRGPDGIFITVTGERARRIVVRREFEEMVRIGLEGLRPNSYVFPGNKGGPRSSVRGLLERAAIVEKIPEILPARLRSTWLAWAMTKNIPFAQLMAAAGLKSANTLTDLLTHLVDVDDEQGGSAGEVLR